MGQHDALEIKQKCTGEDQDTQTELYNLGWPRGSRGVDQVAAQVGRQVGDSLLQLLIRLSVSNVEEFLPAENPWRRGFPRVLNNLLQLWQTVLHLQDLAQLFLVLHHHDVGFTVGQDVFTGLG